MAFDATPAQPRGPLNLRALLQVPLALVIALMAALQYRWINQVSDAQELRASVRLSEELNLVSTAFDTEITRAILAFTIPPVNATAIHNKLEQTWVAWNQEAPWPKILSGISFFEAKGRGWQRRSWGDPGGFDSRSLPASGSSAISSAPYHESTRSRSGLRSEPRPSGSASARIRNQTSEPGSFVRLEARNTDLVLDSRIYSPWSVPALLESPAVPQMNWLVLRYNPEYLTSIVFPQLVACR
jgi:hypothetical protein